MPKRLWEVNHPYYCTEGNYYVGGNRWSDVHTEFGSWAEFYSEWGTGDEDYNAIFRWDWIVPDPADYGTDVGLPPEKLTIFWVLQRKAILRSTTCVVTRDIEPQIREWLAKRATHTRALWEPLLDVEGAAPDA